MSQSLQFGYFNFQGRGQIARLLLAYTKTLYKQNLYSFSNIGEWMEKDKKTLGFDFPSLPYLIEGNFKLTQSRAIQKYILYRANRTDLLGKNNKEKGFIDNIDGVLRDIFSSLVSIFVAQNLDEYRKKTFQAIQSKLNYLNSLIGSKNHLLNRVTYPDFVLNVLFGFIRLFYPFEYNRWQNIERVFQYVNNLPQIISYYKSPDCVSALVAPEWANNPKFTNLKSISEISQDLEKIQKVSISVSTPEIQSQIRPQPQIVQVKQELSIKEAHSQPIKLASQQKFHTQKIKQVKQEKQLKIKKTESISQSKQFNARVQQYMKAAQATNQKSSSELKSSSGKSTIVTPSKLGASNKTSGNISAPWKNQSELSQTHQQSSISSRICLGYWGIRGLGQVQRHLLAYCGHQFTQKLYKTKQQWFGAQKLTLDLPFPNLPYLILNDLKLTESLAIDRYIIRISKRSELLGKNLKDQTYIENIVKILSDLFAQIRVFCFTQNDEKKVSQLQSKIEMYFNKISSLIQNQQFTFGYLTWTDFYVAQISHYIEKIFPQLYNKYSFLKRIRDNVNKDQQIQKYYERENAVKGPFMPPSAKISF